MKRILLASILTLLSSSAFAVCPSTLQIKDNAAVTANARYVDDGSGNCIPIVIPGYGGATPGNEIVPNNSTGVSLKASAGVVWSIQLGGIGSIPIYLKLYDKAVAPTCGTDVPIKRLIIPAASTPANGAGSNIAFPAGVKFSSGIGYCVVTGLADNSTGAPSAASYLVNIDWN
jgi:hypothetical protein